MEKMQKQILPGLVANIIAGKNPFHVPGARKEAHAVEDSRAELRAIRMQHEKALKALQQQQIKQVIFFSLIGCK